MKKTTEFGRFDRAMEQLLKVPHSEIKKKLDEEKEEKKRRKARKKSQKKDDTR
jgi:hypothetical protein